MVVGVAMRADDSDYYRARAIEERWKVWESGQPGAAAIHAELASNYEALADRIELKDVMAGKSLLDSCRAIG